MIARLSIQAACRQGITYLRESYCTPPFKVANITEDRKAAKLHLMLMSSSPGILDGDEYHLSVLLAPNSHMHLHTQSYQRLFHMRSGARQNMEVTLQPGASLVYLPHPSVPHEQSVFTAINRIFLHEGCRLVWGEVLTCGRKLNGEQFRFASYHNITELYMRGKLVLKENLLVQPGKMNVYGMGHWEGYTHQASFICIGDQTDMKELEEVLYMYLAQQQHIIHGISAAPSNGLIVRLMGHGAERLHNCLKEMAAIIQNSHHDN